MSDGCAGLVFLGLYHVIHSFGRRGWWWCGLVGLFLARDQRLLQPVAEVPPFTQLQHHLGVLGIGGVDSNSQKTSDVRVVQPGIGEDLEEDLEEEAKKAGSFLNNLSRTLAQSGSMIARACSIEDIDIDTIR